MPNVFISYRRSDSEDFAGRIAEHLSALFGTDSVFKDVDSIDPGVDFREAISRAIRKCDVVLVLIGQSWCDVVDGQGEKRLISKDDPVRQEIEQALTHDKRCIPVLLKNTSCPEAEHLPSSIRELAFKHALRVRSDPDFKEDLLKLADVVGDAAEFSHRKKVVGGGKRKLYFGISAGSLGCLLTATLVLVVMMAPFGILVSPKIASPSDTLHSVEQVAGNQHEPKKAATSERTTATEDLSINQRDQVANADAAGSDSSFTLPLPPNAAPHPLDRALIVVHEALASMRANVHDYTARMAKRESINGQLGKTSFMDIKIRSPRVAVQGQQTPFSIYMKFLQPRDASGREMLWVDGRHDGNLLTHQSGGIIGHGTFELNPDGMMAMQGQRYPIYETDLENLLVKIIDQAMRDRAAGKCEVTYRDGVALNKRPCSLIEIVHHEKRTPYVFHKAQILIDDELNLPVRYTAYDWPKSPEAKPQILEQYTFLNLKINVGLTDEDFNPKNPAYSFPNRQ